MLFRIRIEVYANFFACRDIIDKFTVATSNIYHGIGGRNKLLKIIGTDDFPYRIFPDQVFLWKAVPVELGQMLIIHSNFL